MTIFYLKWEHGQWYYIWVVRERSLEIHASNATFISAYWNSANFISSLPVLYNFCTRHYLHHQNNLCPKRNAYGSGEMAQWLRALPASPGHLGSILSTLLAAHNCITPVLGHIRCLLLASCRNFMHVVHRHTCRLNTHAHKILFFLIFKKYVQ